MQKTTIRTWLLLAVASGYGLPVAAQQDTTGTGGSIPYNDSTQLQVASPVVGASLLAASSATADGTTAAAPKTTFYQDCTYGGKAVKLAPGSYTTAKLKAAGILNNSLSAVSIPAGYEVELYDQDNYKGTSFILTASQGCLSMFNDQASSVQIRPLPTLTIASPKPKASFTAGTDVPITVTLGKSAGAIRRVEFLNGSTLIGADATAPYAFTWKKVPAGSYKLKLRIINTAGKIASVSHAVGIEVNNQLNASLGDWSAVKYPEIVVIDKAPGSVGSRVFYTAFPEQQSVLRSRVLAVLKQLHYNTKDSVKDLKKLTLSLVDFEGVADATIGTSESNIRLSTRFLATLFTNKKGNYAVIRPDLLGVLSHEITHSYQYSPRNAGNDWKGFIEGVADAVRIAVGLSPRSPEAGGNWKDGYTTTGHFIWWMMLKKDPNFLRKFQSTSYIYDTWTWDAACRGILGVGVQPLWNEYQAWLLRNQSGQVVGSNIVRLLAADGSESELAAEQPEEVIAANSALLDSEGHGCVVAAPTAANTPDRATYEVALSASGNSIEVSGPGQADVTGLHLYDGAGRLATPVGSSTSSVDITGLSNGLYFLTVEDRWGTVQKKKILITR